MIFETSLVVLGQMVDGNSNTGVLLATGVVAVLHPLGCWIAGLEVNTLTQLPLL